MLNRSHNMLAIEGCVSAVIHNELAAPFLVSETPSAQHCGGCLLDLNEGATGGNATADPE